jgi:hypothetical protein
MNKLNQILMVYLQINMIKYNVDQEISIISENCQIVWFHFWEYSFIIGQFEKVIYFRYLVSSKVIKATFDFSQVLKYSVSKTNSDNEWYKSTICRYLIWIQEWLTTEIFTRIKQKMKFIKFNFHKKVKLQWLVQKMALLRKLVRPVLYNLL